MFEIPNIRAAERRRSSHSGDLDEYARLEFPQEDVRTIRSLAMAAVEGAVERRHRWFPFFRPHSGGGPPVARNV
jgi:hypothetical protein